MAPEEIEGWLNRRPYIPLRFHVSGGVQYDVMNPNFVMLGKTIMLIGLRRDLESRFFDEPVMVALGHVIRIEPVLENAAV